MTPDRIIHLDHNEGEIMNADTWPPAWWSDRSRELLRKVEKRSEELEAIHPVDTRQGGVFDSEYARLAAELCASVSADFKIEERRT